MENDSDFIIKTKLAKKSGSQTFDLTFRTTSELFSYKKIDEGTQVLVGEMEINEGDNCLDLGCGYGVLGIAMALQAPKGKTYLVDRDFIGVEYSNKNIKENKIPNATAILSNGFSHLGKLKFDVIASNLPTHIGTLSLHKIISDIKEHLSENGRVYVVTVSILKPFIKREFMAAFGNYEKLRQGRMHTVSFATKNPQQLKVKMEEG